MEVAMSPQEVSVQEKKPLSPNEERTEAAAFFVPYTDVHETADDVIVTLEMPGCTRDAIEITVEKNVLKIEGSIDSGAYTDVQPIYTEYNVGNFTRSFTLSTQIDSGKISANLSDGLLTVTLPKVQQAVARRINVQ